MVLSLIIFENNNNILKFLKHSNIITLITIWSINQNHIFCKSPVHPSRLSVSKVSPLLAMQKRIIVISSFFCVYFSSSLPARVLNHFVAFKNSFQKTISQLVISV